MREEERARLQLTFLFGLSKHLSVSDTLHSSSESQAEPFELTVEDLSRSGSGVSRDASGRVIFVPLTAPGDRVKVRIVSQEKRYAQAEVFEIIEKSPLRVEPRCPVFGQCGGCQWQHLPYELQWKTKVSGVAHALERVQLKVPGALGEFPAERIWNYRNRIQLRAEGGQIGFFARRSHDLVAVDSCAVARPEINAAWSETRDQALAKGPQRTKVEVEVLADGSLRRMFNAPHGAAGFRQVHDEQNEKLQAWVAEAVTPGRKLLDLYGGSGNLSLGLAGKMTQVDCVDVGGPIPQAPDHFRFHRRPVRSWILAEARRTKGAQGPVSAIVDPPREGLAADFPVVADGFESLGVTELVAVGCDPDSWARDLSRFVRRGWRLEKAAVLDLFPQTPHVESLAVLRR